MTTSRHSCSSWACQRACDVANDLIERRRDHLRHEEHTRSGYNIAGGEMVTMADKGSPTTPVKTWQRICPLYTYK